MPVKASGANANLRLRGTAGDSETDINEEINGESTDANANVSLATLSTGVGFDTTDGGHKMSEFFGYSSGPDCTTETWDILDETTTPTKALYTFNGNSKDTGESGYIGQGGIFNGSSKIDVSNFSYANSTFSISLWVNFNSIPTAGSGVTTVLAGTFNGTNTNVGNIWVDSEKMRIHSNQKYADVTYSFNTNKWYQIGIVFETNGDFFGIVNGSRITPTNVNSYSGTNNGFHLGPSLNGKLDQVRIFNKALSSSEVATLASETYASSTKSTTDIFGDNSGLALYEFEGNADDTSTNYDGTDTDVKYGLDGTDSTITYTTGLFGNAASFNGSNSRIPTPINTTTNFVSNLNDRNVDFSISLWINPIVIPPSGEDLVFYIGNYNVYSPNYHTVQLQLKNGQLVFSIYNGTEYTVSTSSLSVGNWYNVVCIRDSSVMKLYVNNSFIGQTTQTNDCSISTSATLQFGDVFSAGACYNGLLDQVRFFDKALSSDQIKTLYNEPTATPYDIYIDNSIKTKAYFPLNAHGSSIKSSSTAIDAGQSAVFNGSSSVITLPSSFSNIYEGKTEFTFAAWLKLPSIGSEEVIFAKYNSQVQTGGIGLRVNSSGNLRTFVATSSDLRRVGYGSTVLTANTWHHCVWIWSSNTLKFYVDGSLDTTTYENNQYTGTTIPTTTTNSSKANRFGVENFSDGSAGYGEFTMDQVRVYSSVLSTSDVEALVSETNVPTANLVAHYKLDGNANDAIGTYNASSISSITYSDPALIGDEPSYNGVSLTGVTFDQGKFNRAAVFNGSTSEIVTDLKNSDLSTLGVGDFSVSFWVYQNATASHAPLINGYKAANNGWYIELVNGKIYTLLGQDGSTAYRRGYFNVTLNLREWYHIVYDNKNNRVWLNGAEITSTFVDDSYLTVTTIGDAEINIGRQDQVNNYWFNGAIDQVRFLEGSITKEDVTKLSEEYQCDCNTNTVDFPTTNLAFYNLNGNANDSTTNNYNGTVSGSVNWIKGLFGTAASFNGSSGRIEVANASKPSLSTASISFWLNTTSTNSQALIGEGYSGNHWGNLQIYLASNKLNARSGNASTTEDLPWLSTSDVNTGNWVHCVVTISGNTSQIFINGTLETTKTLAVTRAATTNPFTIGQFYANGSLFGSWTNDVKIDQVRIFNNVLTDLQVAQLFNTTPCLSSSVAADILGDNSVVAFYSMDDVYTDSTSSHTGSSNGTLSFVDGKTNKALKLSTDTQGYIQTNLNWLSGDSVSLSFWFKADSTSDLTHAIFYADPNPGQSNENAAFIGSYTGAYSNEIVSIGGWTSSGLCLYSAIGTSSTQLYDNQWHSIVFTIGSSSTDKKIYVDGVKQTILNGSAFGSSLSNPVEFRNIRIGAYTTAQDGYAMDNFRFYNKVLSDAEVITIYNAEL